MVKRIKTPGTPPFIRHGQLGTACALTSAGGDTTRPTGWMRPSQSLWARSSGLFFAIKRSSSRHRPEVHQPHRFHAPRAHFVAGADPRGLFSDFVLQGV